ncbi:MAG: GlsB/YeaQ/YmgE family stress response membrane protein [Cucumibacter sp.]
MQTNNLVIWLVVGLVAGFLASLVVPISSGLLGALVAGVIGSIVGGYLFQTAKVDLRLGSPLFTQIVIATIGAIIVIIVARLIT